MKRLNERVLTKDVKELFFHCVFQFIPMPYIFTFLRSQVSKQSILGKPELFYILVGTKFRLSRWHHWINISCQRKAYPYPTRMQSLTVSRSTDIAVAVFQ